MNWNNIRTIEKTQHNGFEELICQLAAKEKIPEQKRFARIGKPDGGKECFWELEDGSLHSGKRNILLQQLQHFSGIKSANLL